MATSNNKTVDFYFDFGSPATYVAWARLPAVTKQHNAQINWKPMLLGAIFKATGNQSPAFIPAKGKYTTLDLGRFAKKYGVELNFNPFFPINTLYLMRGAVAYLNTAHFHTYMNAIFTAMWVDKKDMNSPEVVADVIATAGLNLAEFQKNIENGEVKETLKAISNEAIERGVFGAPTFFVGEQMFFGQDRLDWVADALS